jgi:LPXTG-motif cell wall-anchored protein
MIAVMDQIDALEDVLDTGGITPDTIALAGIVLLTGGSLLLRRIVSL